MQRRWDLRHDKARGPVPLLATPPAGLVATDPLRQFSRHQAKYLDTTVPPFPR